MDEGAEETGSVGEGETGSVGEWETGSLGEGERGDKETRSVDNDDAQGEYVRVCRIYNPRGTKNTRIRFPRGIEPSHPRVR